MFMLMGAVYLHRLPELEAQFAVAPELLAPQVLSWVCVLFGGSHV